MYNSKHRQNKTKLGTYNQKIEQNPTTRKRVEKNCAKEFEHYGESRGRGSK